MKKLFSLFAAVLFAGSMMAETSTLTFTAKCNGSGTADDEAVWTVTSDGTESTYESSKGIHYGTSSAQVGYIQLATSSILGTITKVVVNASAASDVSANVSVSVGGTAFTSGEETSVAVSSTATDYTFTGSGSGEIIVKVYKANKAKKAIYCKSVEVTYTPAPETKVADPKFSLAEGTYEGTQSIALTCKTEGATIYYTVDGTDPTAESAVYTDAIVLDQVGEHTIKALAMKEGLEDSEVVSASYTIIGGPDVTLDFSDNTEWQIPLQVNNQKTTGLNEYTAGDYTISLYGPTGNGYYYDATNNNILLGKQDAYMTLPVFPDDAIARIVTMGVEYGSGSVTFNIYQGETAVSDEVTSCQPDQTFEIYPRKKNVEHMVKVTNNNNIRIQKIKIWFGEESEATAISNTAVEAKAVKSLENGMLVIEKAGKKYNVMGQIIK